MTSILLHCITQQKHNFYEEKHRCPFLHVLNYELKGKNWTAKKIVFTCRVLKRGK
jgi:hypothetical protein